MSESRISKAIRTVEALPSQAVAPRFFDGGGSTTPRLAKVISATPIQGAIARWTYTVQPMRFDPTSGQSGDFVTDGPSITGAKNLTEWNNNALGTFDCGNGVRFTSLTGGYTIKPASIGTPIVRIHQVGSLTVFQLTNGTDRP